jgi:pyrroloquinoline quinone (PQQ) biosynthesis protein C/quercetin dioxygenase-like cupin family protein
LDVNNGDTSAAAGAGSLWSDWLKEDDLAGLSGHPLLQALERDEVGPDVLRTLLIQHSHYSRHFTRYLFTLITQIPNADDVSELMENLREEMGVDGDGVMTHADMFQRTLRTVGADPASQATLPETQALIDGMMGYCRSADPVEGLAAMCLGAEAIVPLLYKPVLHALKQFGYGPEATEFFSLHIDEDDDHALTMLKIIDRMTGGNGAARAAVVEVGKDMIDRRVAMFDAIWAQRRAGEEASATPDAQDGPNGGFFSSSDFWRVPSRLQAVVPERLRHEQVMDKSEGGDERFSAERNHKVNVVDLPSRTISMTIGRLDVEERTRLHRHNYETVIYVLRGQGYSMVGGRQVPWRAGDAIYVPVWASHQHVNTSDDECVYVACENAPLLQNLGGIALREELGTAVS